MKKVPKKHVENYVVDESSETEESSDVWYRVYAMLYMVGVQTIRLLRTMARFTRQMWLPVAHGVRGVFRRFWHPITSAGKPNTVNTTTETPFVAHHDRRMGRASQTGLLKVHTILRRSRRVALEIFHTAIPLFAIAVLVMTVNFWRQAEFGLALHYQGETIGYVSGEEVYTQALRLVNSTVINSDGSFTVGKTPTMTVSLLKDQSVLTDQELCDRLLASHSESLTRCAGLYVDGMFRGALPTTDDVQRMLDDILKEHESDDYDGVAFFNEVTILEGLYPNSALITETAMAQRLASIKVMTIKNITYTETVKYSTIREVVENQPLGFESVKTKGVDGKQKVYAQVIYVDGEELYQTVVSTETIKAVVNKVIAVGAQKYSDDSILGDGVATGTFVWPLPYTKTISSFFASRWGSFHGAIDISNGRVNGKPIIASDGGVVIEAGRHNSYGNYVLIDHGNGFKTRYAHCSKLNVKQGQKVAQGEYIAKVGNTGYSFGAHLHFEIIENGKLVDPLIYVQR